jgi:hypothetical protein
MNEFDQLPLLARIPEPTKVRARLAQLVREQSLLRCLLRLSQKKQEALEREALQHREADRAR